jgi:hypothetical protein
MFMPHNKRIIYAKERKHYWINNKVLIECQTLKFFKKDTRIYSIVLHYFSGAKIYGDSEKCEEQGSGPLASY